MLTPLRVTASLARGRQGGRGAGQAQGGTCARSGRSKLSAERGGKPASELLKPCVRQAASLRAIISRSLSGRVRCALPSRTSRWSVQQF
jgi:hypothetical protein